MDSKSNGQEASANDRAEQSPDPEKSNGPPLRRSALRALVQDFGPFW